MNNYTLIGRLLQRAQVSTWLVAGLEPGTFGFQAQVISKLPNDEQINNKSWQNVPFHLQRFS